MWVCRDSRLDILKCFHFCVFVGVKSDREFNRIIGNTILCSLSGCFTFNCGL